MDTVGIQAGIPRSVTLPAVIILGNHSSGRVCNLQVWVSQISRSESIQTVSHI